MVIDTNTLFIILTGGIVIAILLGLHTEWRMSRLLRGKSGKDLEEVIIRHATDIERFRQFRKEMGVYFKEVEKRLGRSVQGVGTIRFDPFRGTGDGGRQSFASAFVNEAGDGVVLSTLHTRERVSVFAKPLKGSTSEYELTQEEKEAIKQAQQKLEK